jgi:hypothetical protein
MNAIVLKIIYKEEVESTGITVAVGLQYILGNMLPLINF